MVLPSPFIEPTLRDDLPRYPHLLQLLRVTAATVAGPSGLLVSLYASLTQQLRTDNLTPRDREPCLVLDVNGAGLSPGYYSGRLAGSFGGLPVYEVTFGGDVHFSGTPGGPGGSSTFSGSGRPGSSGIAGSPGSFCCPPGVAGPGGPGGPAPGTGTGQPGGPGGPAGPGGPWPVIGVGGPGGPGGTGPVGGPGLGGPGGPGGTGGPAPIIGQGGTGGPGGTGPGGGVGGPGGPTTGPVVIGGGGGGGSGGPTGGGTGGPGGTGPVVTIGGGGRGGPGGGIIGIAGPGGVGGGVSIGIGGPGGIIGVGLSGPGGDVGIGLGGDGGPVVGGRPGAKGGAVKIGVGGGGGIMDPNAPLGGAGGGVIIGAGGPSSGGGLGGVVQIGGSSFPGGPTGAGLILGGPTMEMNSDLRTTIDAGSTWTIVGNVDLTGATVTGGGGMLTSSATTYTGTTTNSLVAVFDLVNTQGIHGSYVVSNTGGSNSLQAKATWTDMFGNVVAGAPFPVGVGQKSSFVVDEITISSTPIKELKFEVQSLSAGLPTTYSVILSVTAPASLSVGNGGTGSDLSGTGGIGQIVSQPLAGGPLQVTPPTLPNAPGSARAMIARMYR